MRTANSSGIRKPRLCSWLLNSAVYMGCLNLCCCLGGGQRTTPCIQLWGQGWVRLCGEGVPKALPSYSFSFSLVELAGWLSPARWERRKRWWENNDHSQRLLWGPLGWPFWHKLAPRLIVPPVFPCCWLSLLLKHLSTLRVTGTGCPGRLWSLHFWRYSKAV